MKSTSNQENQGVTQYSPRVQRLARAVRLSGTTSRRSSNRKVGVCEGRVRKSKSEFESRFDSSLSEEFNWSFIFKISQVTHGVEMTVVDENTLAVGNLHDIVTSCVQHLGGVVGYGFPDGVGKSSTWIDSTVNDIHKSIASFLRGKTCPNHGGD